MCPYELSAALAAGASLAQNSLQHTPGNLTTMLGKFDDWCFQATAESPARDVQSAAGIFLLPAYALQEFAWLYFAANRDRTNRRRLTCKRPDRRHVATPNR